MRVQDAAVVIRSLAHTASVPDDVLVSYAALVAADVSEPVRDPDPVLADSGRAVKVGARDALLTVLTTLDQWVKDVRANKTAREWVPDPDTEFVMHPGDVRALVADVAREIGVEL